MSLPPGWARYTTEDGKEYFHHAENNVTQWDKPVELAVSDVYTPDMKTLDLSASKTVTSTSALADVALTPTTFNSSPPTGTLGGSTSAFGAVEMSAPRREVGSPQETQGLTSGSDDAFSRITRCCTFVSVDTLQEYFDVSSDEVKERLLAAAMPFKVDSETFRSKPDMWGPFWIATTAVLFLSGSANFSKVVELGDQAKTDYSLAGSVGTVIYGSVVAVPIVVRAAQYAMNAGDINFKQLICAFGYSLFVLIPVSIVCVTPVGFVRTLAFLFAFGWALAFLYAAVWVDLSSSNSKFKLATAAVLGGAHFLICVYCRFWVFPKLAVPDAAPSAPPSAAPPSAASSVQHHAFSRLHRMQQREVQCLATSDGFRCGKGESIGLPYGRPSANSSVEAGECSEIHFVNACERWRGWRRRS
jgi:hypothetical protein